MKLSENFHSIPSDVIDCSRKTQQKGTSTTAAVSHSSAMSELKIAILHDLYDAPYPSLITLSVNLQNKNRKPQLFGMLQREFSDCLSGELPLEICACEIEAELKIFSEEKIGGMETLFANYNKTFFSCY